ncbi:FHA domain-containing protein [Micromonospora sp. CPCC 206061]|uniref:FHA domain-containing protein n=1 Tax=Micromonospora sp. CPCC 206061 TaxID=3122410 RepID=UPI002FF31ED7
MTLLAETSTSPALSHVPGHGVLSRQGELVLLCDAAPERESQIATLLDALSSVAADRGDGRDLGRRLAGLLAAARGDEFPALCAFGPAGDGIAVLLHGAAEATAVGPDGETRLDGRQAVIFVDRTLPGPVTSLRAMVGESSGALAPDRWSRLDSGVVRAQALVYGPDTVGPPAQQESVAPAPAEPSAPSGQPMLEECSMPAPPVAEPTVVEARAGDGGSPIEDLGVLGTYCRNGHFNDPRVRYCTGCGVSMVHLTHALRPGRRPALGVLTLDDGMTFPLEEDYVLGRHPYEDELVAAGRSRPLEIDDSTGLVSGVHTRVILDGWDVKVMDAGSTYGTYLRSDADDQWRRLPPHMAVPISPGTWVGLGGRCLRYDSCRNP